MADADTDTVSDQDEFPATNYAYILYQESEASPLKYLTITIQPDMTIYQIKSEVSLLWSIPIEDQKLYVSSQELDDNSKKLFDYELSTTALTLVSST